MKRTRFLMMLLAMILVISMVASAYALTASAQEVPDELSDVGENVNTDAKVTYIVTLYWDDDDNAYGTRPESVEVVLTANGGEFGCDYLYLSEETNWECVKTGLPMFYHKGSRTGVVYYEYEVLDLPENYNVSIVQEGNWFKATCTLVQNHMIGDADGDEDITSADAVAIQRHDCNIPVGAFNAAAADVNGDKEADIIDATIIQRYLVGLDCSRYELGKEI